MNSLLAIDGFGVHGSILHYTLIIAFTLSALLIFIYLWRRGRLDMDEEPKWQMMNTDEDKNERCE